MRIVPASRQSLKRGDVIWHLEVVGEPFYAKAGSSSQQYVVCKCRCGLFTAGTVWSVKVGDKKSCGCWHDEATSARNRTRRGEAAYNYKNGAGSTHARLYRIWRGMKERCYNEKCKDFKNYGGRGIGICSEWLGDFLVFRDWAAGNGYGADLTIERNNVDGNYEPSNCSWIPLSEQLKNRRNCVAYREKQGAE